MRQASGRFRQFNRFYTGFLGLLQRDMQGCGVSYAESRVMFELQEKPGAAAVDIAVELGMDRGQLSRVLSNLSAKGLLSSDSRSQDRRMKSLSLSPEGEALLDVVDAKAQAQAEKVLGALPPEARAHVTNCMGRIESLLGQAEEPLLREGRAGDLGWILARHGEFYERELGFDVSFEAYVLDGVLAYAKRENDRRGLIMAELAGSLVGSLGLVNAGNGDGQLRWFYVEPWLRSRGLGRRLMERGVDLGRQRGFKTVFLWTISNLDAARRLYQRMGFSVTETRSGLMGGREVEEERWELQCG